MITIGETYVSDEYLLENGETGELDDATVTVTITLPNGSTDTPTLQHPAVGVYSFTYPTTLAGRHDFTVTATAGFLGPTVVKLGGDVFHVDDASTAVQLVGLRETKEFLNIPQDKTQDDEELRRKIVAASDLVEDATRLWHRATVVEEFTPARVLVLSSLPVVSVTSVEQSGSTIDAAAFEVSAAGILQPLYTANPWSAGWGNTNRVTVTYEAGETAVPPAVREAVLKTVLSLWESQRGASLLPLQGGLTDDQPPPTMDALPPEAERLLERWRKAPAIA